MSSSWIRGAKQPTCAVSSWLLFDINNYSPKQPVPYCGTATALSFTRINSTAYSAYAARCNKLFFYKETELLQYNVCFYF